jgi:hypothetical protein
VLQAVGCEIEAVGEDVLGSEFASPIAVWCASVGTLRGGANPYYPAWAAGILRE